jgi:cyclopropane-fatty-acyl-phospholipid synthase
MSPGNLPLLQRVARRGVLAMLARIETGEIRILDGLGRYASGKCTAELPEPIEVHVRDPQFWVRIADDGVLGAADAYIRGEWACSDLTGIVRAMLQNAERLPELDGGWTSPLRALARRILHRRNRNDRRGSRANIRAHYDLGNAFFQAFLDPSLTYSCGWFETPDATLEQASIAKYERLCRRLALSKDDRVLEIGTGWGGFALHAVRAYGCHVTTTTISAEQHALAAERIAAAGLSDRITLLLEDYRELRGRFDKLVSIEMIEAVGHEFLDGYFRACTDRLTESGIFGLQAITIRDQRYEAARREVDFIKRWIFPGGHLPSLGAIAASTARATDLQIREVADLTPHYVRTLRAWRGNFERNRERIRGLGYGDDFLRMWEFYFCYCEAAFLERNTGCQQILLARPRSPLGSI